MSDTGDDDFQPHYESGDEEEDNDEGVDALKVVDIPDKGVLAKTYNAFHGAVQWFKDWAMNGTYSGVWLLLVFLGTLVAAAIAVSAFLGAIGCWAAAQSTFTLVKWALTGSTRTGMPPSVAYLQKELASVRASNANLLEQKKTLETEKATWESQMETQKQISLSEMNNQKKLWQNEMETQKLQQQKTFEIEKATWESQMEAQKQISLNGMNAQKEKMDLERYYALTSQASELNTDIGVLHQQVDSMKERLLEMKANLADEISLRYSYEHMYQELETQLKKFDKLKDMSFLDKLIVYAGSSSSGVVHTGISRIEHYAALASIVVPLYAPYVVSSARTVSLGNRGLISS
jgi:hypothetical protein